MVASFETAFEIYYRAELRPFHIKRIMGLLRNIISLLKNILIIFSNPAYKLNARIYSTEVRI